MGIITMEDIMKAELGEDSSKIRATFKKTVQIKQYESEVIELEGVLNMPKKLNGAERMLANAILKAQLEYTGYVDLTFKRQITEEELVKRKEDLEQSVNAIKVKAERVTGKNLDEFFDSTVKHALENTTISKVDGQ